MDESNAVVSAYATYRHLQQYCSHPSTYRSLHLQAEVIIVAEEVFYCIINTRRK